MVPVVARTVAVGTGMIGRHLLDKSLAAAGIPVHMADRAAGTLPRAAAAAG